MPSRKPKPPFKPQHQARPGKEERVEPRPRFDAPDYRGSGKLDGRVALITGGDSGIGRAVAVLFAREGADVAIVYLLEEQEDAQVTEGTVVGEDRRCLLIPGDVRDAGFCGEAVDATIEAFGLLDILVNNAAYQHQEESPEDVADEQLERTVQTNIFGYFYMARAALPHLQPGSCIINTGSITGLQGNARSWTTPPRKAPFMPLRNPSRRTAYPGAFV